LLGISEGGAHSLEPILSISRFLLGGSGLLLFGFGLRFRFRVGHLLILPATPATAQ
jgi:hypothetical protein